MLARIKVTFITIRTCARSDKYYLFPYSTVNNILGFVKHLKYFIKIQRKSV